MERENVFKVVSDEMDYGIQKWNAEEEHDEHQTLHHWLMALKSHVDSACSYHDHLWANPHLLQYIMENVRESAALACRTLELFGTDQNVEIVHTRYK